MTNRRDFIRTATSAGILSSFPGVLLSKPKNSLSPRQNSDNLIWAYLIQLSNNMWNDHVREEYKDRDYVFKSGEDAREWALNFWPELTFDEGTWNELLKELVRAGVNMVVIDLGDGVSYESHPEIAVKNAWSTTKLRRELEKLRKMGLEPIPKLNFAATHDVWMGEYSRMVSTEPYYAVCRDLIAEVIKLFDTPRFFHLGMDEETANHQKNRKYVVVRQFDLWWEDLFFYIDEVEKNGSRPWIWSDYGWYHKELFLKKMPKSVVQSNWYYWTEQRFHKNGKKWYEDERAKWWDVLDKNGFDQIPTGSNHHHDKTFELIVEYCSGVIDPGRLLGYFQTPWNPTIPACLGRHLEAIEQAGRAIMKY